MPRVSVGETKPNGTFDPPPTQAQVSCRSSMQAALNKLPSANGADEGLRRGFDTVRLHEGVGVLARCQFDIAGLVPPPLQHGQRLQTEQAQMPGHRHPVKRRGLGRPVALGAGGGWSIHCVGRCHVACLPGSSIPSARPRASSAGFENSKTQRNKTDGFRPARPDTPPAVIRQPRQPTALSDTPSAARPTAARAVAAISAAVRPASAYMSSGLAWSI